MADAAGDPGPEDSAIARSMAEGARRSLEARGPDGPAPAPASRPSPGLAALREPRRVELWRRHKWKVYGLLFVLLTELCILMLGKTLALGPG